MITLKDIAKRVGKDISTVSLAMRGDVRLKRETREEILSVAHELGYRPNVLARAVRGRGTNTVGLVLHNLGISYVVPCLEGIENIAGQHNQAVLVQMSGDNYEMEHKIIYSLVDRAVDGLIIEPTIHGLELYKELLAKSIPLVFVLFEHPELNNIDVVLSDDRQGSSMAVEHLVNQGHNKIGYIGVNSHIRSYPMYERKARRDGYLSVMQNNNLPTMMVECKKCTIDYGYHAARKLFEQHPDITAVFVASETLAVGVARAICSMDKEIPKDVSLVGFGGGQRGESMYPPLTTICTNTFRIGEIAMKILMERIAAKGSDNANQDEPRRVLTPTKLIVRQSTRKL